jgi:hypothetical protein
MIPNRRPRDRIGPALLRPELFNLPQRIPGWRTGRCVCSPPLRFFGCAGLTRVKLAPLSRIWVSRFLDVPVPTDFSIPYTDLELTTTDNVKIKAFLLLQRPNLGMNETQVASGEESGEEVWHLPHKATPLVPGN